MAEKKSHEVDAWIRRPDRQVAVILLYGPDRGLVSERATLYARSTALALDDPFAVIRFDSAELERDPSRLRVEVDTLPMFGGERLIWIRNGGQSASLAAQVKDIVDEPPAAARLLVEAGELKKGSALRTTVERAAMGMALPCYGDEGRSLDALVSEMLGTTDLAISADARVLLKSRLGADRLASRGEIEKLIHYCRGQKEVTVEDVLAAVGDAGEVSVDRVVDAVLAGKAAEADSELAAALRSGGTPHLIITALARQFQQIDLLAAAVQRGAAPAAAVASARPPVFFNRRKLVEGALGRWRAASIARALEEIGAALLETRRQPPAGAAISGALVLKLSSKPFAG